MIYFEFLHFLLQQHIDVMSAGHKKNLIEWIDTLEKILEGKYDSSSRTDGRFQSTKSSAQRNTNIAISNYRDAREEEEEEEENDSPENDSHHFFNRNRMNFIENQFISVLMGFFGNRISNQLSKQDFSLGDRDSFIPKFSVPKNFNLNDYPYIKTEKILLSFVSNSVSFDISEEIINSLGYDKNIRLCFVDKNDSRITPQLKKLIVNSEEFENPLEKIVSIFIFYFLFFIFYFLFFCLFLIV